MTARSSDAFRLDDLRMAAGLTKGSEPGQNLSVDFLCLPLKMAPRDLALMDLLVAFQGRDLVPILPPHLLISHTFNGGEGHNTVLLDAGR